MRVFIVQLKIPGQLAELNPQPDYHSTAIVRIFAKDEEEAIRLLRKSIRVLFWGEEK